MITAQFSATSDAESAAICWATNGEFSHVDIVLADGNLLGARSNGGVKIRPPGYEKFSRTSRMGYTVPNETAAYAFWFAQIGKGYNEGAILDMLLHRTRNFYLEQPKFFCDELFYAGMEEGGLMLLNTANPATLTPWEVYLSPLGKVVT